MVLEVIEASVEEILREKLFFIVKKLLIPMIANFEDNL